jgi:hypothetical protein
MLRLSREVHCALAGIKVEAFKTLQRYGWYPSLPSYLRPGKPFAPIETLTLALYNTICEQHRVHRAYGADICSGADILLTRWEEMRETVAERRYDGKDEIMFGRATYPGLLADGGGPKPVLGTLEEIAAEHQEAMAIITVSVTRVGNVVSNLAMRHGVDLDEFWAEPASSQRSSAVKPPRAKKRIAR